jgi:hypothetical protein
MVILSLLERLAHFSREHFLLCTWFGEVVDGIGKKHMVFGMDIDDL